jgi:hypothetical protein
MVPLVGPWFATRWLKRRGEVSTRGCDPWEAMHAASTALLGLVLSHRADLTVNIGTIQMFPVVEPASGAQAAILSFAVPLVFTRRAGLTLLDLVVPRRKRTRLALCAHDGQRPKHLGHEIFAGPTPSVRVRASVLFLLVGHPAMIPGSKHQFAFRTTGTSGRPLVLAPRTTPAHPLVVVVQGRKFGLRAQCTLIRSNHKRATPRTMRCTALVVPERKSARRALHTKGHPSKELKPPGRAISAASVPVGKVAR